MKNGIFALETAEKMTLRARSVSTPEMTMSAAKGSVPWNGAGIPV